MYRYRDNSGCTSKSIKAMKHLLKIGDPLYIKGYVYKGRYNTTHPGVLVRGTKGSCRFSGFSWGYMGEGPRGLIVLLKYLGVNQRDINSVMSKDWQFNNPKECWRINFD